MTIQPCSATLTTQTPGGRWVWTGYEGGDEDSEADRAEFDRQWIALLDEALAAQAPCAHYEPGTSSITVCITHAGGVDSDEAMDTAHDLSLCPPDDYLPTPDPQPSSEPSVLRW